MRPVSVLGTVLCLLAMVAEEAGGRVYLTQQEALARAFPPPQKVERRTLYLDADQARLAAESAGVPVEGRVVPYYVGTRDQQVTGYGYFDTHLVRTLAETVFILLSSEGQIARIDIVSFDEPEDYLPPGRWLEQFRSRGDLSDLAPQGSIRALTGATLSARAVTQAARRVLAIHRLLVAPAATSTGGRSPGERGP